MKILLTGGAGYIGSHVAIELYTAGHTAVIADNLINSSREAVRRVEKIVDAEIPFYELDIRDETALANLFQDNQIDAVIHLAGLKAVGESVEKPLEYYDNNLNSTLILLRVMQKFGVNKIIFSSSATVYGDPEKLPFTEDSRIGVGITNPYGWTKFMNEQILRDAATANPDLEVTLLRYFNPVGAHESGTIGEDPNDTPNNLMPFVAQVAVGKLPKVKIFGDDYDTVDGTGVRDYIHVVDLARGHVAALGSMDGVKTYNLASGRGVSVLELIHAFQEASGREIPYEIAARRPGDIAASYASADKAFRELNWRAEKTIADACADSWRWQSQNPNGY
ncbi:UDP-glucose 4-epimerase GalE [Candidatus Saccharibacteria bacterium]|nr:UDP-glucose 4-epimerase GalE [Candidatus Saccharibacteria bacterium]MCL1963242.1 UDP-glucose 4-epimerase GalE [Candidatus Saccharibacteria bacterium]